jgi:hypothetical protein
VEGIVGTKKPLLVPVRLAGGGIMHDTDYARGAESVEAAAYIDAECLANSGHMRWGADYVMQEVAPFYASLRVYQVGNKSSYVLLMDPTGASWPMFLSDYVAMMSTASVTEGDIEPMKYETCKKGSAYGIRPVK